MATQSLRESSQVLTKNAGTISYTVDSFDQGIAFGQHTCPQSADPREYYALRLQDDYEVIRLRSRYALNKENPFYELERHLQRLSKRGELGRSTIYFGVTTDPFFPFEGKFDASMKFLSLFERYLPGRLVVQTRSPLVVLAMPVLRKLGSNVSVTIGIETPLDEMVERYTPGFPKISDRLKTINTLRNFGLNVGIQVSPVLPYGDWKGDAGKFADTIVSHADQIFVKSLTDGSEQMERKIRASNVAIKLARDRRYHWLRADSANPLLLEIEKLAPQKLLPPKEPSLKVAQLRMFAA